MRFALRLEVDYVLLLPLRAVGEIFFLLGLGAVAAVEDVRRMYCLLLSLPVGWGVGQPHKKMGVVCVLFLEQRGGVGRKGPAALCRCMILHMCL